MYFLWYAESRLICNDHSELFTNFPQKSNEVVELYIAMAW